MHIERFTTSCEPKIDSKKFLLTRFERDVQKNWGTVKETISRPRIGQFLGFLGSDWLIKIFCLILITSNQENKSQQNL